VNCFFYEPSLKTVTSQRKISQPEAQHDTSNRDNGKYVEDLKSKKSSPTEVNANANTRHTL
jgi:hypothetical protein